MSIPADWIMEHEAIYAQLRAQVTPSSNAPDARVIEALEAGVVEVTRRIEIYEADGVTPWYPNDDTEDMARLIGGSVTVDYNSDERRKIDIIFHDPDRALRPNPNNGFWYDKILKPFRGVRFPAAAITPTSVIIEAESESEANKSRAMFSSMGFDRTAVKRDAVVDEDLRLYEYIISVTGIGATAKSDLLKSQFDKGKKIVTIGTGNGMAQLPFVTSEAVAGNTVFNYAKNPGLQGPSVTGVWTNNGTFYPLTVDTTAPIAGTQSAVATRAGTLSTLVCSVYIQGQLSGGVGVNAVPVTPGTPITYAVDIKTEQPNRQIQPSAYWYTSTGAAIGGANALPVTNIPVAGTYRTVQTVTPPAGAAFSAMQFNIAATVGNAVAGERVWFDRVKIGNDESYFDGSMPASGYNTYAWTGTPNASFSTMTVATRKWGVAPVGKDSPTSGAFTYEQDDTLAPGIMPTGVSVWATRLAEWVTGGSTVIVAASIATSPSGGMWLDIHLPTMTGVQAKNLLRRALFYMRDHKPYVEWETQLGEFMIDGINGSNFPKTLKVQGRDYTKKLLQSKIKNTQTYIIGTSLKKFVQDIAAAGGISLNKMRLSIGVEKLTSEMSYEVGTSRWEMIKKAVESFDYEVFFDAYGFLVVRKFIDPTTGPLSWAFGTGPDGNLVSFDRSTNDSRIFNHIVVIGEPADSETENPIPYFGEAINTDPESPTNTKKIGDRVLVIRTTWLSSNSECAALARSRLKIAALESYEMNISSIYYPWQDVGEIVAIVDPEAFDFEPTRFLLDGLTYPFDLGAMSGTAKRITYVGQSGSPTDIPEDE